MKGKESCMLPLVKIAYEIAEYLYVSLIVLEILEDAGKGSREK